MIRLSRRTASLLAAALIVTHALLAWLARGPGVAAGRDDAKYLLLGRAVRQFSYRELWRLDTPPHAQYPPGYPAAIAMWGLFFGERFDAMVVLNLLASLGTLVIVFAAVRARWGSLVALLVLLPLAVNPYLVSQVGMIASEPLFMLLSIAALALVTGEPRPRREFAAGALAIGAALTRSAGVPIVAALAVAWLLARRWKAAVSLAAVSAVVLGWWFWWTVRFADRSAGQSYIADAALIRNQADVAGKLARMGVTAKGYLTSSFPQVLRIPTIAGTAIDNVIAVAILLTVSIAALVFLWKSWRAACVYLLATAALLLVWPWHLTRFLVPLLPLLVLLVIIGTHGLIARWKPAAGLAAAGIAALLLALNGGNTSLGLVRARASCTRGSTPPADNCVRRDAASFLHAAIYLRDSVPAGASILTAKPEPVYLYSGHASFPVQSALRHSAPLVEHMRSEGVNWVLLGSVHSIEPQQFRRLLQVECGVLAPVAHFPPRTWLFRVRPLGEAPDSTGCAALAAYQRANLQRNFRLDP